jgi:glycerol-1-phosphate dehydrogenase [NAD(P)+]
MNHIWNLPFIEFMPFNELVEDRPILLVASEPAWQAVKSHLPTVLSFDQMIFATDATLGMWNTHLSELSNIDQKKPQVIYAIGGGLAVDEAKFLACQTNLPLVCMPTALSVDAFFTWASGIRRDGCVQYIETKSPEKVIIDFTVLGDAPPAIRSAGICDILSIATGCWDWQFADEKGQNPPGMDFIPYVYANAQTIFQGALDCAEAAGEGDAQGLKQLLNCLCLEVQLCNQIGHSRPEEGSEHYFAYAAEYEIGHGFPHGDLVGPGIMIMAQEQGQDINPIRKALMECHIPMNSIHPSTTRRILQMLPDYCTRHRLPFGIAHMLSDQAHRTPEVQ